MAEAHPTAKLSVIAEDFFELKSCCSVTMIPAHMKKLALLLAFFTLCVGASSAGLLEAQVVDLDKDRLPVAPLPALWRFHAGDNPAWADPKFDDSGWSLLKSDQRWGRQGYKGYSGFAWYRFRVEVMPKMGSIAISLPQILYCSELFANGQRIGSRGKMPPNPSFNYEPFDSLLYSIPPVPINHNSIEIAVRVWSDPRFAERGGGPISGGGLIGNSAQLEFRLQQDRLAARWRFTGEQTNSFLQFLAGIGSLVLFALRRRDREYLWFGIMLVLMCLFDGVYLLSDYVALPVNLRDDVGWGMLGAANVASIAFYDSLLKPRRGRLFKLALTCTSLSVFVFASTAIVPWFTEYVAGVTVVGLLTLPMCAWIVAIFVPGVLRDQDARLLVFPVFLRTVVQMLFPVILLTYTLGWQGFTEDYTFVLTNEPFPISLDMVAEFLFLAAVFGILIFRFTRTRGEQERYATEVEGARSVQQFLIPDDLPQVPGLVIESDYRPAREVGGDFFQVIPDATDGSALVVVGDVAGKGMQAGMLATLLVGAMRTAATFTRDPAVILSTLNNRLCGKGNATCLALRIEADGRATLVNAGHLPPYRNGVELPMEGALPLGTLPNLDFPVLHFEMSHGDTITLISDGILEAQKPDGELFGFARITEHLAHSATASSLAVAAQDFGQEDDITVLTIARLV